MDNADIYRSITPFSPSPNMAIALSVNFRFDLSTKVSRRIFVSCQEILSSLKYVLRRSSCSISSILNLIAPFNPLTFVEIAAL